MSPKPLCWGVFRERAHSPGREDDDARVLRRTAERLTEAGLDVRLLDPEALEAASRETPALVFYMCERADALAALEALQARGTRLVNPLDGVLNTYRDRMLERLAPMGDVFPASRLVATDAPAPEVEDVWVKRGDFHQTQAGDVVYAADTRAAEAALKAMAARGVETALLQEHVEGDLIKFYGVGTQPGAWFHQFYHRDQVLKHHPFDLEAMKRLVREAARRMDLEVYGGDVIVTAEGRMAVIDVNAWPSFALVCDEASERIAEHLRACLEEGAGAPAHSEGGMS